MSEILYIDASAGMSGDMTVGALLDLGADIDGLKEVIKSLGVSGFTVNTGTVEKQGISCCDFDVILEKEFDNHDHDMEYLYGHDKTGDYEVLTNLREDAPKHNHHISTDDKEHIHNHDHNHTHSDERCLSDIFGIIDSCSMSSNAKEIAKKTFRIVALAEANVHGRDIDEVHFHEVGALDSIADIIAASYCLDNLGISDVIITHLTDGQGTVRCRHGIIPVPVPAVNEIVMSNEIPLELCDVRGELVTPTGAAFAAAVRTMSQLPQSYRMIKSGYGNGKRDYPTRGYLAAHIIEADRI